jgi:hypothetical protein
LNQSEKHEAKGRLDIPNLGVWQSPRREALPHKHEGTFVYVDDIYEVPRKPKEERKNAKGGCNV